MSPSEARGARSTSQPAAFSFSGHETFVFRSGWLKKALDAVLEDPGVFNDDEAMAVLGVGKNMVRSIRHWALAARLLDEEPGSRGQRLLPSELGLFLLGPEGHDPYLEDPSSLWLIHWSLASNAARCTAWSWVLSLLSTNEFTRESLARLVQAELRRAQAKPPSEATLKRDLDVLIRTYLPSRARRGESVEDSLDCPLVELGLIEENAEEGGYSFRRGPKRGLGDALLAYAITDFWERRPHQESLSFSELAYGRGSPGCLFKLDENSLTERLNRLEGATDGSLVFGETAGLKQLYRRGSTSKMSYLLKHYQGASVFSLL